MPRFLILYCTAFAFLAAFIQGGMYWHDSPEFIMTSFFLLPSHPAGSPAYSLVAHALTWLPLGPIPARVALLSTVSSGVLVGVLAHWVGRASLPKGQETLRSAQGDSQHRHSERSEESPARAAIRFPVLAAVGILLFGAFIASPNLRTYALVPEVYPLHAALLAAAFFIVSTVPGRRGAHAGPFALGLAASIHFSTLFYLPLFLLVPRPEGNRPTEMRFPPRAAFSSLAMIGLGFSTHLFLALRSIPDAPLYWGDLSNPVRLIGHLMGTSEYGYLWRVAGSSLIPQLHEFFRKLAWEFPWPLLAFAGLGLVSGLKSKPWLSGGILLGAALHIAFFMRFESFPAQYYLVWAMAAFAAGLGSHSILDLSRLPALRAIVCGGVGFLGAVYIYRSVEEQFGFRRFAQEPSVELTLEAVPSKGTLVHSGQFVFQANYLSSIEHRRPDIRSISLLREGLTEPDQVRIVLPHLSERRPTTLRTDIDPTLFPKAEVAGPIFVIEKHPGHPSIEVLEKKWARLAERFASPPPPDFPTAANIARMTASQARWALWKGRPSEAGKLFETASAIQPRYATAIEGLGKIAEMEGRSKDALRLYREALDRLSPTSPLREKYGNALSKIEDGGVLDGNTP